MNNRVRKFSFWGFTGLMSLQFVLLLLTIRTVFPTVWESQLQARALSIILVFIGMHFWNCFAEWALHRYLLHAAPFAWLRSLAVKHRHHHSLTAVRLQRHAESNDHTIVNRYPIESQEQLENAIFPRWALIAVWAVYTPFLIGLHIWSPTTPFLFGGYAAVAWSLTCYEIFHHIEHFPFEWWERRIAGPFGNVWKKVYGFHLMHHANIGCNEAISGFFGLPIADWSLGTYQQPKKIFLNGDIATARDFALPPPRRFVRRLDQLVKRREVQLQKDAQ